MAAMIVASGVLPAPLASAGTTSFTVVATPNPHVANGNLASVSCVSASDCVAVGGYSAHKGTSRSGDGMAELWDGQKWSLVTVAAPEGAVSWSLQAVSCVASGSCEAVGAMTTVGGGSEPLIEAWDGTTWSEQAAAGFGASVSVGLDSISCVAASSCMAVGQATTASAIYPVAEVLDGATWSTAAMAVPSSDSYITGVSCTSPAWCEAVGYYLTSSVRALLAETWDGTAWTSSPITTPPGASFPQMNGVSCTSADFCNAVGDYDVYTGDGAYQYSFGETWDGSNWSTVSIANRPGQATSALLGVICVSSTACTAVGGDDLPLVESWDGSTWSAEDTPDLSGAGTPASAACTSTTACVAVGSTSAPSGATEATAASYSGGRWQLDHVAQASGADGFDQFQGVSCASTDTCTAVGDDGSRALAESEHAGIWSVDDLPAATPKPDALYSVSCAAADVCEAVGDAGTSDQLIEGYNGSKWAVQAPPGSTKGEGALLGVSCGASSSCIAVGVSGSEGPLAEAWNGTRWTTTNLAKPSGSTGRDLSGVACTSATACTAVGAYENGHHVDELLAEDWDGARWSLATLPQPPGATSSELQAVSCTSDGSCAVAGDYEVRGGNAYNFAETEVDGTWTVETKTPVAVQDLSCADSSDCVGVSGTNTDTTAQAEQWDGTRWSQIGVATPPGSSGTSLYGVACTIGLCTSVGSYLQSDRIHTLTLAEDEGANGR